ncbi:hypothetical protein BJ508DRAFT_325552 [Ascobolus immersus RN42]|uniref:F-box domain-containing protein n=1 Tax=Ascobolus immersus RN42 TaxID=1160509 RepID=A0A3N4I871_ASCIM|nr:hypothetical protein BJ508DRAFT_325552 [Ascobolus immersus RN42]
MSPTASLSKVETLPVELKLQILLYCDFASGNLHNLCTVVKGFYKVFLTYHKTIQKALDVTDEMVQLLDRFRCTENGMGYLGLEIFANIHHWMARFDYLHEGLELAGYTGDQWWENEPSGWLRFVTAQKIHQTRKTFTKTDGIVGSVEEGHFIERIRAFVKYLYKVEYEFGYWSRVLARTKTNEELEEESVVFRRRIQKSLLQFLIHTTHMHNGFLTGSGSKREAEREREKRECRDYTNEDFYEPCSVADYTYIAGLPTSDLAILISTAAPIIDVLYGHSHATKFGDELGEIAVSFGFDLSYSGDGEDYYDDDESCIEIRNAFVRATSTGPWVARRIL